jgi:hypothetical protein
MVGAAAASERPYVRLQSTWIAAVIAGAIAAVLLLFLFLDC